MRAAAISALDRLNNNDIVSVVAFDDQVEVVLPATKLTDKAAVRRAIKRIEADGSTNLFGGVSKGAEELRKFLEKQRVNRVVLLSDDGSGLEFPEDPRVLGPEAAGVRLSPSSPPPLPRRTDRLTREPAADDINSGVKARGRELLDVSKSLHCWPMS